MSLLTSRCKILSKVRQSSSSNGPGGDSGPSTQSGNSLRGRSFKLNSKFSSHLYRVRVPFLKKLAGTSRFEVVLQCLMLDQPDCFAVCSAVDPNQPVVVLFLSGDGSEDALSRAAVLQTRIHHIDSVVVRILKARRRIGHQALVLEVAKHLVVRASHCYLVVCRCRTVGRNKIGPWVLVRHTCWAPQNIALVSVVQCSQDLRFSLRLLRNESKV